MFCVLSATAVTAPTSTRENIRREDEAAAKKPLGGDDDTTAQWPCVYIVVARVSPSRKISLILYLRTHIPSSSNSCGNGLFKSPQVAVSGATKNRNVADELQGVQGLIVLVSPTDDAVRRKISRGPRPHPPSRSQMGDTPLAEAKSYVPFRKVEPHARDRWNVSSF